MKGQCGGGSFPWQGGAKAEKNGEQSSRITPIIINLKTSFIKSPVTYYFPLVFFVPKGYYRPFQARQSKRSVDKIVAEVYNVSNLTVRKQIIGEENEGVDRL